MVLESCSQAVDCIERGRRDVVEGSPVVGDEVTGFESFEEGQSITAGQMPFLKTRFPPRRVADGQKCHVQITPSRNQVVIYQVCSIGR